MVALLSLACLAFVTLAVLSIGVAVVQGGSVRSTMGQLVHYADADAGPRPSRPQTVARALQPVATWATRMGRRLMTAGHVESARRRLTAAGWGGPDALDRFLSLRMVGLLLLAFFTVAGTVLFGSAGRLWWAALISFGAVCILAPDAALNRAAAKRQHAVRASLPEVLDLLTISVESGFGLEQALERVAADLAGPLSDELRRVHGEVRAGASWSAAMRALSDRVDAPQLKRFTLAITQADSLGVPIAPMLRAQSEEIRVRRRQLAQERAQKAPVKMLLPMVFCIFPALFVAVIGPAIINMRHGLG